MRSCVVGSVMHNGSEDAASSPQSLSALADGELDPAATLQACARWHADADARASWHVYHLIGDVMRSDDLASDTSHDASFLKAIRKRLATEPVVLAPQPVESAPPVMEPARERRAARWSWLGPAAVAAGFMAFASVLVMTRVSAPSDEAGSRLAQAAARGTSQGPAAEPRAGATPSEAANLTGEVPRIVADGMLLRDARLERYFAAHTQFGGSSALGAPSGFLRAATTQTPGR
jgi:sigma-E factor negative regulatory protein RseA